MASSTSDQSIMSVLELTRKPLITVPQQFVRKDREPSIIDLSSDLPKIPLIDLKNLVTEETSDVELQKLHVTCKDWGIFQLVNHGISPSVMENLKNETEAFFNLPFDKKVKYKIRPGDFEGYGTGIRTGDAQVDWGDSFYMVTNPINKIKPHLFHQLPPSLRTILESYFMELEKLAMKILGFLAKVLKIEKREMMEELFEDGRRSVRMSYYPPCPQPELVHGLAPHSDATGITILSQLNGVNGLEIKKDGVWIPVNFIQDAFVVNVGDTMEIMSNGSYKSVEHRAVVNSSKERMSITMFFNPRFEAEIGPVASLINPQNPPLFKTMVMEKYVNDFLARRDKLVGKKFLENMRIQNEDSYCN